MSSIMPAQFAHFWRTVPRSQSRICDVSLQDLLRLWVQSCPGSYGPAGDWKTPAKVVDKNFSHMSMLR